MSMVAESSISVPFVQQFKEKPGLYEGRDGMIALMSFVEQLILRETLG